MPEVKTHLLDTASLLYAFQSENEDVVRSKSASHIQAPRRQKFWQNWEDGYERVLEDESLGGISGRMLHIQRAAT